MGLDSVELALAFEEAFAVSIDAMTWRRLRTPRQLIAHLVTVLPPGAGACSSQQAFHAVRRGVMHTWRLPREAVRPSTPWTAIIPRSDVRQAWASLGESVSPGYWPQRWIVGGPRSDHATVGTLASFLATTQPARIKQPPVSWTAAEIEVVVRAVLFEEQGIANVVLDADFARDLGIS